MDMDIPIANSAESDVAPASASQSPISALRRINRPRPRPVLERCDLCSAPLAHDHQHLLEPSARQIMCACDACAVLFTTSAGTQYKRVPRTIERWSDFQMSDLQWAGLGVPIALAFFFHGTPQGQVAAMYPSPGGPTEAVLPGEAWQCLVDCNPALATLEPDVEALLVNRVNGRRDYYRAPIDECYKLVGLIRTRWRGLSGGADVWKQIPAYFDELQTRAAVRGVNA
jgi:hypothetical protein